MQPHVIRPCRVRILDELEPGAVFSLWKATVSKYVMAENRKEELYKDYFIWQDFPSTPGEVGPPALVLLMAWPLLPL